MIRDLLSLFRDLRIPGMGSRWRLGRILLVGGLLLCLAGIFIASLPVGAGEAGVINHVLVLYSFRAVPHGL